MADLVTALGSDRAREFVWAGSNDFGAYAQVARESGLPPGTAGTVMQLAAETGDRAWQIHADPALSGQEKQAAFVALQKEVLPQFDQLLPKAARDRLAEPSLAWVAQLGAGSYKLFPPTFSGRNSGTTYSLAGPPRSTPLRVPELPPGRE